MRRDHLEEVELKRLTSRESGAEVFLEYCDRFNKCFKRADEICERRLLRLSFDGENWFVGRRTDMGYQYMTIQGFAPNPLVAVAHLIAAMRERGVR